MERTKGGPQTNTNAAITYMATRMALAATIGQQSYGGERDIYQALGYKTTITYEDYYARYRRQDIAKAIIDRPATVTWSGKLILAEKEAVDSSLEKAWGTLEEDLGLKSRLIRLDKLTAIGDYGVLLLGFDDITSPTQFATKVRGGSRKLLYVKPYGQGSAKILTYDKNPKSPRFSFPETYQIESMGIEGAEAGDQPASSSLVVHHSRIIHVAGDLLESDIFGRSKLEAVFNRLFDMEKIIGGDAEMFWRGARPGYAGKTDPDYSMTEATKTDLKAQIDEYEHNLRRILVSEGVSLEALEQQIADPTSHVDIQISMISAVTGIPKRILIGSERGELSSAQDKDEWLAYVQTRRDEFVEPNMVRPLIDRLMDYGVLPKTKYDVRWEDLFSLTEKERVEIGSKRALALRDYSQNPVAPQIMGIKSFLKYGLGLSDEAVEAVMASLESDNAQEQALFDSIKTEEIAKTATPSANKKK